MNFFKIILSFFFLTILQYAYSQNGEIDSILTPDGVIHINKAAMYPGGRVRFYKDVSKYFEIPKETFSDDIHGTIMIEFTIDTLGNITKPIIIESLREEVDKAVIDMLYKLKRFAPATNDNKPVPYIITLPIEI